MNVLSNRAALHGEMTICGSKSHTIRAVLLAAIAEGTSVIHNPLTSDDARSALRAAQALGAEVTEYDDHWVVSGRGGDLSAPENFIDTGNSGTTTYLVTAVTALCKGYTFITGDEQIRRRPIIELAEQLRALGADVFMTRPGSVCPPLVIGGHAHGGTVHFCGKNSQYVSGVMLAAPLLQGDTEIFIEQPWEKPYLQLTIDWMKRFGVEVVNENGEYRHFTIRGGQSYHCCECVVPADWSGALFPTTAAVLTPSELKITGVDFNDSQGDKAIIEHLIAMGADIRKDVANNCMTITGGKPLHALREISLQDTPDSLPILSLAAACAEGTTRFVGLAHVRVKESDRVAVMEEILTDMGCVVRSDASTMTVEGGHPLRGICSDSRGDHRIAMTLAVAGMLTEGPVTVERAECASVSYPGFYKRLSAVGASFREI